MSTSLLLLLCVLACPVVMALMMLFMRHGHREHGDNRNGRADE
jgi:hypothetical protein